MSQTENKPEVHVVSGSFTLKSTEAIDLYTFIDAFQNLLQSHAKDKSFVSTYTVNYNNPKDR